MSKSNSIKGVWGTKDQSKLKNLSFPRSTLKFYFSFMILKHHNSLNCLPTHIHSLSMAAESELEGLNGAPDSASFIAFFMRHDRVESARHDRGGKTQPCCPSTL